MTESGAYFAISDGDTLCMGRFTAPLSCDLRRDGKWSFERNALSRNGAFVIAKSDGEWRVLGTPYSETGAAVLDSLNQKLGAAEKVFFGPHDTVCAVTLDPEDSRKNPGPFSNAMMPMTNS